MNIPFKQSPNYSLSSTGKKIGFIFHGTIGSYQGAIDWLCKTSEQRGGLPASSAHYIIGRNEGEIIQLVRNTDVAWHAGVVSNPNEKARAVLPKKLDGTWDNPNKHFIGIEFVWGYDVNRNGSVDQAEKTLTDWQVRAAVELIKASGIPPLLLNHTDVTSYKGDNVDTKVILSYLLPAEEKVCVMVPKSKIPLIEAYLKQL